MSGHVLDWTQGEKALVYRRCRTCAGFFYFRRPFCAACGGDDVEALRASGEGVVYAATVVTRAPSPEWKALAPYGIALVDAAEGFRFMAHAAEGLEIGDAVRTRYRSVGDALVPFVEHLDR